MPGNNTIKRILAILTDQCLDVNRYFFYSIDTSRISME